MRISLMSLHMQHFKGFKDYTLRLGGADANIYGANATGKTTLIDAFTWLLFGVDSVGTPSFSPKPYDADGQGIHNLESSVTAELWADNGKHITLCRTMTEDWVKQRGETERTFKGNIYGYIINDVPSTQTDFNNYVKSIVSQDVFKMITNPMAFNALDWKKRRQMLLDISGGNVDETLLAMPKYAPIAGACQQRGLTIDELRTATGAQRKRLNETLERIPVQIAEVQRMGIDVDEAEINAAAARRAVLLQEIEVIDTQLTDVGAIIQRHGRIISGIAQKKIEMADIEREMTDSANRDRLNAQATMLQIRQTLDMHKQSKATKEQQVAQIHERHAKCLLDTGALRTLWGERNAEQFAQDPDITNCPTCGQVLPEGTLKVHVEDARQRWQSQKDKDLAEITANGKELKQQAERYTESEFVLRQQIQEIDEEMAKLEAERAAAGQVAAAPVETPDFMSNIKYAALALQIAEQEKNLSSIDAQNEQTLAFTASKRAKQEEMAKCDAILAKRELHARNAARVEELTILQRDYGVQLADTERMIILIEQFVTDRCKALEEGINALFPTVKWKLFDVQINTGIKDTCVCMIPGGPAGAMVPFPDANNAAKVNAGLEIIDVLCNYYDVSVPVFIDNAESVNTLKAITGQRIALFVSEDAQMRVDVLNKREVA